MNKEIEGLVSKIEALGWSIEEEDTNKYRLSKSSPAGQDFSIHVDGTDAESFLDSIYDAYDSFDVSYETYIWLDNTGHGTNGAPYEMKDVLEDMESCEKNILDLRDRLAEYTKSMGLNS